MNNETWGMRFNAHPEYRRFSRSELGSDYPDWFQQHEFDILQEQGLIVWNNIDKKIHALNGSYTLNLLEQLESHDNWKTEGVSVTAQVTEISLETAPRGKRKKGDRSSWYLITSLTTFYQETSAADQSQIIWNQSRITQAFKEKTIRRARYGYQEVETGFHVYLGACENPDDPWWAPETRDEHIESLALRESICYSLNVTDFRDFLGFSTVDVTNKELLETMHETRAHSKYLAEEIKRESRFWLAQHLSDEHLQRK